MDYLEIVLQGYFNENNREFLEKYFLREYKKAEKEQFFESDEFFNGCLKVIENWEKYLQNKVDKRKLELNLLLSEAKNGTLTYSDMEGKTIKQKRQETIDMCEQELKEVRPDGIGSFSYTIHLLSLTNGRIAYNMAYNEVLEIKLSIHKAFYKTITNILPLPPQPTETKAEQETPNKLSNLITHKNCDEIIEAIKIRYKNIKGKQLKLLLMSLQDLELLPKERIAQKFYDCCKEEFDWEIASYNAMNGYVYNELTDKNIIDKMKQYIETLIKTK